MSKSINSRHGQQRRIVLLLHAFAQHSYQHLQQIVSNLDVSAIMLLDFVPSDSHPYIAQVLQATKHRIGTEYVVSVQQLKHLVKSLHRVFSFEALNQEMDHVMTSAGVYLISPLWFITPQQVRQWYYEQVNELGSARVRITMKGFYRRQTQVLSLPKQYSVSTDVQNRGSIEQHSSQKEIEDRDLSFPTTPEQAEQLLNRFMNKRFNRFAKYQDAVAPELGAVLYHSCLSMAINVGLLLPKQVLKEVFKRRFNANAEAYVRQLLGWREYAICYYRYTKPVISNFKGNTRRLSKIWYADRLNYEYKQVLEAVPIIRDILVIVWRHGYAHHILRLFLLSFMIQLELHPDDIYIWMKQHFVDANDWVMSFNVYAMGYFDTRFTHKAYLFSSNYMVEQSGRRYKRCKYLDALYHRFVKKNPQPRLNASESPHNEDLALLLINAFTKY